MLESPCAFSGIIIIRVIRVSSLQSRDTFYELLKMKDCIVAEEVKKVYREQILLGTFLSKKFSIFFLLSSKFMF